MEERSVMEEDSLMGPLRNFGLLERYNVLLLLTRQH
jgi:hypothetical protein